MQPVAAISQPAALYDGSPVAMRSLVKKGNGVGSPAASDPMHPSERRGGRVGRQAVIAAREIAISAGCLLGSPWDLAKGPPLRRAKYQLHVRGRLHFLR